MNINFIGVFEYNIKRILLLCYFGLVIFESQAQRTCATDELQNRNKSREQILLERERFEEWLSEKQVRRRSTNATERLGEQANYKIPVVVHIIHNGEPIGLGYNIADEQIYSQIEVLNRDFRRLNTDTTNTPDLFKPFAADIGFEFVLAKTDPNGYSTNGITRTKGAKEKWHMLNSPNDEYSIKATSYWPSEDYLNIWVANELDFLGYATFPSSSILSDVAPYSEQNATLDGIIVRTKAFGSKEIFPQGFYQARFDLGRTATHELGHFFGLYHVWGAGDPDCSIDDYIDDTPNSEDWYRVNYGPQLGASTTTCGSQDMFMNYMYYVNDEYMNIFSEGQKERMEIILQNSPRRASLLNSPGLYPPPDVVLAGSQASRTNTCNGLVNHQITVKNRGEAPIKQISLLASIDGNEVGTMQYIVDLNQGTDTTLLLDNILLPNTGSYFLEVIIVSLNGKALSSPSQAYRKQLYYNITTNTLNEDFRDWPSEWIVHTDAPISKWNLLQSNNLGKTNMSAVLNYFGQPSQFADELISPSLDLSAYSTPYLQFDYSYAERSGYSDKLLVTIKTDCGNSMPDTLFIESSKSLGMDNIPVQFTPSRPADWRTVTLDLSSYNNSGVQIAFIGESGGGNNLYLDNIRIIDGELSAVSLKGLTNESGAYSSTEGNIGFIVDNSGTTMINSLKFVIKADKNSETTYSIKNLGLEPSQRTVINYPYSLSEGLHSIEASLLLNGVLDKNNVTSFNISTVNNSTEPPFREQFEDSSSEAFKNWTASSPSNFANWQLDPFSKGYIRYDTPSPGNKGMRNWLVMPSFNFSNTWQPALRYKLSYFGARTANDLLRVWVSTNNGTSFDYLISSLSGEAMLTPNPFGVTSPSEDAHWKTEFLDLISFAGQENIMIAFELIDGDGAAVSLDNFDVLVSNNPDQLEIELDKMAIYPNPTNGQNSKVVFNLVESQDIELAIIDITGSIIRKEVLPYVLNQTYPLSLQGLNDGVYLIQARGINFNSVKRILISN